MYGRCRFSASPATYTRPISKVADLAAKSVRLAHAASTRAEASRTAMAAFLFRKLHDNIHRTPLDTRATQARECYAIPPHFSAPPRTTVAVSTRVSVQIHDFTAQHFEPLRRKRFGEEVCVVIYCAHVSSIAHLPAAACTISAPGSESPPGRGGGAEHRVGRVLSHIGVCCTSTGTPD